MQEDAIVNLFGIEVCRKRCSYKENFNSHRNGGMLPSRCNKSMNLVGDPKCCNWG
jgi:hypothetical protein